MTIIQIGNILKTNRSGAEKLQHKIHFISLSLSVDSVSITCWWHHIYLFGKTVTALSELTNAALHCLQSSAVNRRQQFSRDLSSE